MKIISAGAFTESQYCFDVQTVAKSYGSENSWNIGCKYGTCQGCVNNVEFDYKGKYYQRCCLPSNQEAYNIHCYDSLGDGWHGGYLEINGIKYCDNDWNGYVVNGTMTNSNIGRNVLYEANNFKININTILINSQYSENRIKYIDNLMI